MFFWYTTKYMTYQTNIGRAKTNSLNHIYLTCFLFWRTTKNMKCHKNIVRAKQTPSIISIYDARVSAPTYGKNSDMH